MAKMDWFEIWYEDKQSMIDTMVRNMVSDLDNGYDYFGKSITGQRQAIDAYRAQFDAEIPDDGRTEDSALVLLRSQETRSNLKGGRWNERT